jgi:lysophospholipase L1-like esterase
MPAWGDVYFVVIQSPDRGVFYPPALQRAHWCSPRFNCNRSSIEHIAAKLTRLSIHTLRLAGTTHAGRGDKSGRKTRRTLLQSSFSARSLFRSLVFVLPTLFCLQCVFAVAAYKPLPPHWVATWATANWQADNDHNQIAHTDTTLREIVRTTLGGSLVRVELSNEFGTQPLQVGAVHLALAGSNGAVQLSSANALTFDGKASTTIAPGAVALSDPAALTVKPGSDLAVSIFLPAQALTHLSSHSDAFTTSYLADGDQVGRSSLRDAKEIESWYFIKSVQVEAPGKDGAIVAFGDSITDGSGSTQNAHNRWVDVLGRRLQHNKRTAGLAIVNEGIGGNRILNDGNGPSALARFDRDALSIAGVRYIILLESINDIGHLKDDAHPGQNISADQLTQAMTQLIAEAHAHGIKIILATLTPYAGAGYDSPEGEQIRKQVNAWIRSNTLSDGVVDLAAATSNPDDTTHWKQEEQAGDQLHPSPAGHTAMANAFNLKLFNQQK